jgi:hypothetical protein
MMFSGFANFENDEPFEILILSNIYKSEGPAIANLLEKQSL